jgi:diguanylate cyclase
LSASTNSRLFDWIAGAPGDDDQDIRALLLGTIGGRAAVMVIGAATTLFLAVAAAILTHRTWPLVWMTIDVLLLGIRLGYIRQRKLARQRGEATPIPALLSTGAAWSLLTGLGCYGCMVSGSLPLAVMAAIVGAGVSGGIASRNSATPRYAVLAIHLVMLPLLCGAILSPIPGMAVVGLLLPFCMMAVCMLATENYKATRARFRAEQQHRLLAFNDVVTGLPNRLQLLERLEWMCAALRKRRRTADAQSPGFALLYIDLDGFKWVNDTHGHAAGDAVLEEVGRRLTNVVRGQDIVCRLGGDEFVILLPGAESARAKIIAERMIASVSMPYAHIIPGTQRIGASIGGVLAPDEGNSANALLSQADLALYEAKRRGKGWYYFHSMP